MSKSEPPAKTVAAEILEANKDISPLFGDVVEQVTKFRKCGLPDSKIRKTVPGVYRVQQKAAEKDGLRRPGNEEIRVISLPREFQRDDWR
jgi:hypothetical protein